jgi:tRNA (mo5U34)-methyltransferase
MSELVGVPLTAVGSHQISAAFTIAAMVNARDDKRSPRELQQGIDALFWYHTIDVAPGVVTPGWWDLRHALPLLPFPDLKGKRCLDIGTWDGFYAYEMERRGAAEVVAVDLADLAEIDFPPDVRADPNFDPRELGKQPRNAGFHLLHEILGSAVQFRTGNIYDLPNLGLGTFDFVMLGNLLIHLRDPVRALDAARHVTHGQLLLADEVYLWNHLVSRRRALFQLRGVGRDFQWWVANDAGLRQLLHVGGFRIEVQSKPFLLRPGPTAPARTVRSLHPKAVGKRLAQLALTGDMTPGSHLQRAYLATPRFN